MSFLDELKAGIAAGNTDKGYNESVSATLESDELDVDEDDLGEECGDGCDQPTGPAGMEDGDEGLGAAGVATMPEDDEDEIEDKFDRPESLELSPEEDAEADSIIDVAATPVVLQEILAESAVERFVESAEFDIAMSEGLVNEGMKDLFSVNMNDLFTEAQFYNKNMVRFTKQARTNQLFEICVQAIARAKNDPLYFKLAKVQRLRRGYKAVLRQRYKAPAMKKAKEYIMRLKASKAPTIANAAKKLG